MLTAFERDLIIYTATIKVDEFLFLQLAPNPALAIISKV
jgi:hypothetical protein